MYFDGKWEREREKTKIPSFLQQNSLIRVPSIFLCGSVIPGSFSCSSFLYSPPPPPLRNKSQPNKTERTKKSESFFFIMKELEFHFFLFRIGIEFDRNMFELSDKLVKFIQFRMSNTENKHNFLRRFFFFALERNNLETGIAVEKLEQCYYFTLIWLIQIQRNVERRKFHYQTMHVYISKIPRIARASCCVCIFFICV